MTLLQTFFRRARTLLWTAFSILVILAAVVIGVGKLLIPYADRYQPKLEAWLSAEFGQPVVLESLEGEWSGLGPRLSMRGMRLLPPAAGEARGGRDVPAEVVIESAALDIKPFNFLLPGFPLYNFRVIGADFELLRSPDGEFRLSGFGVRRSGSQQRGSALQELARVGEVHLENSSLRYRDEMYGIELDFRAIDGRLHLDGDELASEFRASVYDDPGALIIGEVEATVLLVMNDERKVGEARWQATARELMLAAFQRRLPPSPFLPVTGWFNAELWGHWSSADGHRVRGVTDLTDARLVNPYQDLWLNRVNTRFQWHFSSGKHWDVHFADFLYDDGEQAWTAPRLSMARNTAEGLGLWISADQLPLAVPLRLARDVMSIYGTPWPAFLPGAAGGMVGELDLVLDAGWRIELARGEISGGAVSDWERWPDLAGLEGRVALARGGGRLDLRADELSVVWPRMFRDPFELSIRDCPIELDWRRSWQARIRNCRLENADLAAVGEAVFTGNAGRPAVDLNVTVTRGQVARVGPYLPESVLKDRVKSWLREGLVAGQIEQGRVSIHGDLDDWPFRNGEGRFEAVAHVTGGVIDYYAGWPTARDADVVARFVNSSMDIQGQVGALGGVPVRHARAIIPDFREPVLTIDYAADSDVPRLLRFLWRTPLQDRIGGELERFEFAGSANTRGTITIPFSRAAVEVSVAGSVALGKGRFRDPGTDVTIDAISGQLSYSELGFAASGLEARLRGRPARLDLLAQANTAQAFRAELTGSFAMAEIIPGFLKESLGRVVESAGQCAWRVSVTVPRDTERSGVQALLRVESGLEGVSLGLPAPLTKPAGDRWPLRLELPLTGAERVLRLEIADRFAMGLSLHEGSAAPRGAALRLGGGAALPVDGFVRVEGRSGRVDLDGWIELVLDEAERIDDIGGLVLDKGEIGAEELIFLDRRFADVDVQFTVDESGVGGQFTSADLDGSVRFTSGAGGSRSLSAEFRRLVLDEPLSQGIEMETDPSALPALHLFAHSLRYAGVELGEARIEAYPVAGGFHFEKIDTSSERLKVKASGDWLLAEGGARSDFDIHVASESLGDFLHSMDIASPVQGGQTLVKFNAWWPGPPAAFALSRLNGELEFSVVGGNITEANAGSGRLLGLLSVQALPKRLALDFRDVFDAGFAFDEASGTFAMENGTATTDDVILRSSSANISVSGRTDLVARQYDQILTIRPGVGNTLPIIGALAGGPGGAAAGLALQGLLHEQLAEATQVRYVVTGSWEDPKFEAVEVERQGG